MDKNEKVSVEAHFCQLNVAHSKNNETLFIENKT